jgi:glyoxylase-like metal-dependent hydrolase (beta-lactamase superfamily II)
MGKHANNQTRNEFAQKLMARDKNKDQLGYHTRYALLKIRPGLWQLIFYLPVQVNCWLIQDKEGLTMIDAAQPWNAPDIIKIVKAIGIPLRKIIITHAHPDHAGAAAHLAAELGTKVFVHELDVPFMTGQGFMHQEQGFWLTRSVLGVGHKLGILTPPAVDSVEAVCDREVVGDLQIIHSPGHTPGSVSIWWDEQRALFCGDNIVYSFRSLRIGSPWFTLDLNRQRESIRKYVELKPNLLLSGHGSAFYGDVAGAIGRL